MCGDDRDGMKVQLGLPLQENWGISCHDCEGLVREIVGGERMVQTKVKKHRTLVLLEWNT